MKLYRVTFQTSLLIEAENEKEAVRIGEQNLQGEVRNGTSELYNVETLRSQENLRRGEKRSLPWRDWNRKDPEMRVEDLLPPKDPEEQ